MHSYAPPPSLSERLNGVWWKKKKEEPIRDLSRWSFWLSPRYTVIAAAGRRQRQIQKAPLVFQNICSDFKWKGGIVTREGVITALQMAPTALRVNIMEPARAEAEQKRRLTHLLPGGGLPRLNNRREKKEALFTVSTRTFFAPDRQTKPPPAQTGGPFRDKPSSWQWISRCLTACQ